MPQAKTIGAMNGWSVIILKATVVLITAIFAMVGWILLSIVDMKANQAAIRASCVTTSEQHAYAESVDQRFSNQRELIAAGNGQATSAMNLANQNWDKNKDQDVEIRGLWRFTRSIQSNGAE
jgi:hypothetical protein